MIFHQSEANPEDLQSRADVEVTYLGKIDGLQAEELFRPLEFPCKDCSRAGVDAGESANQPRHNCVEAELEAVVDLLKRTPDLESITPVLDTLPTALQEESPISHDLPGLEKAIRMRRSMLSLYPTSHSYRKFLLADLAVALRDRFDLQGEAANVADIDEAITNYREVLGLAEFDDPILSKFLESLARTLKTRFKKLQDPDDLEEAIERYESVVLSWPDEKGDTRAFALYDLADTLKLRFERSGDLADLNLMIDYHQRSLALVHEDEITSINNRVGLARALVTRHSKLKDVVDIERAVALQQEALATLPCEHASRPALLFEIGVNLLQYSKSRDGLSQVDEAIEYLTEGLRNSGKEGDNHLDFLASLAAANLTRFKKSNQTQDVDDSLTHCREALNIASSPEHSSHRSILKLTASALLSRYRVSADPKDLQESIGYYQKAFDTLPLDSPKAEQLHTLTLLSNALLARFESSGHISDINHTVAYLKKAAQLTHLSDPEEYTGALTELAAALGERFNHTGDLVDSDDAIGHCHRVMGLLPSGHPNRLASLKILAGVHCARSTILGGKSDLDEAVLYFYELVSTTKPEDNGYPDALAALAHALNLRSISGEGAIKDIKIAERCLRKALDMSPEPHPSRSNALKTLAHVLRHRSSLLNEPYTPTFLNDLVAISREEVLLHNPGHPLYPKSQFSLASALQERYKNSGEIGDLENAITAFLQAEETLPKDHPLQGPIGFGLALSYLTRGRLRGSQADHEEAFSRYEDGSNRVGSGSMFRFYIARSWAFEARHSHHRSALRAFTTCLPLLDRHIMVSHNVESKHKDLAQIHPSLVPNAAACAIDEGQLEQAVELLEQGRAILWSQVGRYRTPLDHLSAVDPELANEFHRLNMLLDKDVVGTVTVPRREAASYRLLSNQWDSTVERIRKVDGFSNFLKTTPFTTLQQAAASGPVIVINIDVARSDAIIIQSSSPPTLIRLPDASSDVLASLSTSLTTALQLDAGDNSKAKSTDIISILRQLWVLIVSPIVDELRRNCSISLGARVWWCPTSSLWSLPLHAAGPYKRGERNLPDIFTSSYTPTLSALHRSINRKIVPSQNVRTTLLVGQTQTPGQIPLPGVVEENHHVQELAPSVTLLDGERATRAAIISDLRRSSWVHFACHGHQDLLQPFNSHFSVYDGPLTLLDIIRNGLPNAELAFLSACHSAAGDQQTPNEAIHLAAGLQFSGFASVVGTLWAMADVDGPIVAREFYKYMMQVPGGVFDYRDGAVALNHATKELRRMNVPVERWINFIHIGA